MYMNGTLLSIIVLHIPDIYILYEKKILVKSITSLKLLYLQNSITGLRKGIMNKEKGLCKGKLYADIVSKMDIISITIKILLGSNLESIVF